MVVLISKSTVAAPNFGLFFTRKWPYSRELAIFRIGDPFFLISYPKNPLSGTHCHGRHGHGLGVIHKKTSLLLPQKLPQRPHVGLKICRNMSSFCLYQSQVAAQTRIWHNCTFSAHAKLTQNFHNHRTNTGCICLISRTSWPNAEIYGMSTRQNLNLNTGLPKKWCANFCTIHLGKLIKPKNHPWAPTFLYIGGTCGHAFVQSDQKHSEANTGLQRKMLCQFLQILWKTPKKA